MFCICNDEWDIRFVHSDDKVLQRSDTSYSVGVTDYNDKCIYLSDLLYGKFLKQVLCHEIVHCMCFSIGIHISIKQEEWLANFVSIYGEDIVYITNEIYERINAKAS